MSFYVDRNNDRRKSNFVTFEKRNATACEQKRSELSEQTFA